MLNKPTDTNHFIFIVADIHKTNQSAPSAYDVALYRLESGVWGIGEETRCRRMLDKGDRVMVYLSGKRNHGRSLIAHFDLKSGLQDTVSYVWKSKSDNSHPAHLPFPFFVELGEVNMFKNYVNLVDIRHELNFVKNPSSNRWGVNLIGGCVRIPKTDYNHILKLSGTPQLVSRIGETD